MTNSDKLTSVMNTIFKQINDPKVIQKSIESVQGIIEHTLASVDTLRKLEQSLAIKLLWPEAYMEEGNLISIDFQHQRIGVRFNASQHKTLEKYLSKITLVLKNQKGECREIPCVDAYKKAPQLFTGTLKSEIEHMKKYEIQIAKKRERDRKTDFGIR